jgi:DNA repair ATPase RecN
MFCNPDILKDTFEKLAIIEKTTETNPISMESLSATVQQLLNQVSTHSEKILTMEAKVQKLQQVNRQLRQNVMEIQHHSQRWNLKLHRVREEDGETIDNLGKVAPRIQDKLPDVNDVVHRLGRLRYHGSPRTTIMRFTMIIYRDVVWKEAKKIKCQDVK